MGTCTRYKLRSMYQVQTQIHVPGTNSDPCTRYKLRSMYQVQTQIHVCDMQYADFVCTQSDIQTQRIEGDRTMWAEMVSAFGWGIFQRQILLQIWYVFVRIPQFANNNSADVIPEPSYLMSPGFSLESMYCSVMYLSIVLPHHIFDI